MKTIKRRFKSAVIQSDFLYGFGNSFNIYGNNVHRTCERISYKTDRQAIASDWATVGNDFRKALNNFNF